MRLRNLKNKEKILAESEKLLKDAKEHRAKWHEVFSNKNPIHLEIGMGKGDFLIEKARAYPEINFLGIEKYDSVIARAVQKLPEDLNNIYLLRADATEIEEFFDKEIDLIYLNFSDPWPKARHANRRLTSEVFLNKYKNIFKNEMQIVQKTDNRALFEFSLINYASLSFEIKEISLDLHKSNIKNNIMTEYEKKFLAQTIYYIHVKK